MAASYALVSGPPASGKSTLACKLATELELPLISKDVIKEALFRELDVPNIEASRRVGRIPHLGHEGPDDSPPSAAP